MKHNRFGGLQALWDRLRGRAGRVTHRVAGELTAEGDVREPIDFSAPSIPYYTDLAARFGLARIVLYMILLVFVVVTIISNRHLITYSNLYYLAKDINAATITAQSTTGYFNYPVSTVSPAVATYRGGLAVVGSGEVTVISGAGKQTLSESATYARPCVRAADRYFLAFGRGEENFSVYNAFGRMYYEDTAYPVYDACMGDNGSFAVLTRSQDYTSEVILYNDDMDKLANVHLGGHVTALATTPTGNVTAILSVESAGATPTTKLTLVRVGDRITTEEVILADTLVGGADFLSDDRLAVVCRDRTVILNADGRVVSEVPMEGRAPLYCAFGNGSVALLTTPASGIGATTLTVIDRNGRVNGTADLPSEGQVAEVMWNGNCVYIRMSDRLLRLSSNGQEMTTLPLREQVLCLLDAGEDTPLICTLAYAYRPEIGAFTSRE